MTRPTWLDPLVGLELRDAYEIEVHFADEEPLTTGDLALETDRGWYQIVTASAERHLRRMRTPTDVELIGDWSGRSGTVLLPTRGVDLAFRIERIDYVQRGASAAGTIGVFLIGEAKTVRVAILLDHEDPEIGPPKLLWDHLVAIARNEKTIELHGRSG
jgi:hypothetical protein